MAWLYGAALSGPGGDGAMHARRILGRPVSQSGRVSVMEKTSSWSMGNWTEKCFPRVFCVTLPADRGACLRPLAGSGCCPESAACLRVCKQEPPACSGQGALVLTVSLPSTWEHRECCVDDGDHSPAWGFNSQSTDPRDSNVLQLLSTEGMPRLCQQRRNPS